MDTIKITKSLGDKLVNIPLNLEFKNNGYSDLVTRIAEEEKQKNVNLIVDAEKMRFYSAKYGESTRVGDTKLKFYFKGGSVYGNNFLSAGFSENDINNNRNKLTKSFFRLDFYDSNIENTQNFLFSEQLYVGLNTTPTFDFNFIYWVKNDTKFVSESSYRKLYFSVTFFNAKDGTTKKFINTNINNDITLNNYKTNKEVRFVELRVLNPFIDQPLIGNKNNLFYIEPINGNTDNLITFTELNILG